MKVYSIIIIKNLQILIIIVRTKGWEKIIYNLRDIIYNIMTLMKEI